MKNHKLFLFSIIASFIALSSCNNEDRAFDASGSFEAVETIISAEAMGTIKELNIEEGQELKENQYIGYIDTTQLSLKKKQVDAQIKSILSKRPNVSVQLSALQQQLKTAETERNRYANLVKENAAPSKQLDDINANIEVIKKQIEAQKSALEITNQGIGNDALSLFVQQEQLNDQISKSILINPVKGTVLTKFAETNEMAAMGKPLYKIADLSTIILRTYISGNQLPQITLNQKVKVYTDDGNGGFKETEGTITWISDKAEFTPKTIQTKDERANMVYAVKVSVVNNGTYKIGMYGEINFN